MAVRAQSGAGPEVRAMRHADCPVTSRLHAQSLPDSFFARLGERFLRAYHQSFVDSPHAVALVILSGKEIDGFLLAALTPGAHGAHVLRQWGVKLAALGAKSLLARPRLLVVFVRTRAARYVRGLWRRRSVVDSAPATDARTWVVLSHIAVDGARRRSGAGAALVAALHVRALEVRSAGVVLLTADDGPGPDFYRRLGYADEGQVVGADGQLWLRFRWQAR